MSNNNFEMSKAAIDKLTEVLAENDVSLGDDKEFDDLIDNNLLVKMLETPTEFHVLETGELAVIIDGEEHVLDPNQDDSNDIAKQEQKLIERLPNIPWDINCQGIKRKQNESIAVYKLLCVNAALKGLYEDEIRDVILGYDFYNLRPIDTGGSTLLSLLSEVEEDAGSVIKFLIACCYGTVSYKK